MKSILTRRTLLLATLLGAATLAIVPAHAQTRVLETTFGAVEIPAAPTRIVTTHYIATQPLLDLGIVPVGHGAVAEANVVPEYWPLIADVPTITADGGDLNYEQIVALAPDLIFEINTAPEQRIERLRQIAPVVLIGISGADRAQWQKRVHQIADAVGALEAYEARETELTARQAGIAAKYSDVAKDNPIAVWAVWQFGSPSIHTANSMTGRILTPAGAIYAGASEALASTDGTEVGISNEDIGAVLGDAGIVFYSANLDLSTIPDTEETRGLVNYQALPAVAEGREFPLGKLTIAGYGDAHAILDNYVAALSALGQ